MKKIKVVVNQKPRITGYLNKKDATVLHELQIRNQYEIDRLEFLQQEFWQIYEEVKRDHVTAENRKSP